MASREVESAGVIGTIVVVHRSPSENYATDVRPLESDGESWNVQVVSNTGEPVSLSFAGVESLPTGWQAWLIDDLLGVTRNLRVDPSYTLARSPVEAPRKLRLLVGPRHYVEAELSALATAPDETTLFAAFPNPFDGGTTISYGLATSSSVSLQVFDVTGRVVATLAEGSREAGIHAVVWDGHGAANGRLPSGVYFLRLRTDHSESVQSVVIAP